MAWKSAQIAIVDTAATPLFDADTDLKAGQALCIKNMGTTRVWLGGSNVTSANGYPFDPGEPLGIDVANNRELGYARCATGVAGTVAVLRVGA